MRTGGLIQGRFQGGGVGRYRGRLKSVDIGLIPFFCVKLGDLCIFA